jgi:large subunit ribosomal protein L18
MRLKFGKNTSEKTISRRKKKVRIRKTVKGSEERPRLSVFRSSKHMYAQIVDDKTGKTLMSISTLKVSADGKSGKEAAKLVGSEIAKQALAKNIKQVVFDRNGFLYHGRIQALAEGAREAGLNF